MCGLCHLLKTVSVIIKPQQSVILELQHTFFVFVFLKLLNLQFQTMAMSVPWQKRVTGMGCKCKTREDTAIHDSMQRVPEQKLVFQTKVFNFIQKFPCCKLCSGGKTESGKVRYTLYVRGRLHMSLYHQKVTTNTKSFKCEAFYFIRKVPCCYYYVLEVKLS